MGRALSVRTSTAPYDVAVQAQRPLQDPNIFGNYEVAYVSMGKAQYG